MRIPTICRLLFMLAALFPHVNGFGECEVRNLSETKDPLKIYWNVHCMGFNTEPSTEGWSVHGTCCCFAGIGPFVWPKCRTEGSHGWQAILEVRFSHGCSWIPLAAGDASSPPLTTQPACRCCEGLWPCTDGRLAFPMPKVVSRHSPRLHVSRTVATPRDMSLEIQIRVEDRDMDLRAICWTQPANGTLVGDCVVITEPCGERTISVAYQPSWCWRGRDYFEVYAVDAAGNVSSENVAVEVLSRPPRLQHPRTTLLSVDRAPVTFELSPAATEAPQDQRALTYEILHRPPPWAGRVDGRPPVLTFIPEPVCGVASLVYIARDLCREGTQGLVEIILAHTPTIDGPTEVVVPGPFAAPYSFAVLVRDADFPCGDRVSVTATAASGRPVSVYPKFFYQSGWCTVTYWGDRDVCTDKISITAEDLGGLSRTLEIKVARSNQPPRAEGELRGETTVTLTPAGAVYSPVVRGARLDPGRRARIRRARVAKRPLAG
jgi:hypothetical protein